MLEDIEPYLHLVAVGGGLLVALLLLVWLGRGVRGGRHERAQTVVGLTPAHALHVVEVAGRRLLVGTGPGGPPNLLLELPDPPPAPWNAAPAELDAPPWVADAARSAEGWRADATRATKEWRADASRSTEGWRAHGP
ncbi:hypothetical protein OV090_18675 [Nannocystis sp. RBIL2]|uniref:hypothetical protein n=1 Tax=Nannocystis sp. RBIL2 TaxID=2996788 RepID=UPI00226E7405|nr:hypothetical protein [Nannocystis sp. RBIL2]MCY1066807.1 hypothetical protein [Nannocystis sp. RBIL2]